jgi:hypothetical protein
MGAALGALLAQPRLSARYNLADARHFNGERNAGINRLLKNTGGPDRKQHLDKAGPQQSLRRDRGTPFSRVEPVELGIQADQRLVHDPADLPQRVPGRQPTETPNRPRPTRRPARPQEPQRRSGLPGREALERDPRLDDRSGCQALPEVAGRGGDAVLHGAHADGAAAA